MTCGSVIAMFHVYQGYAFIADLPLVLYLKIWHFFLDLNVEFSSVFIYQRERSISWNSSNCVLSICTPHDDVFVSFNGGKNSLDYARTFDKCLYVISVERVSWFSYTSGIIRRRWSCIPSSLYSVGRVNLIGPQIRLL